ncbi:MAG: S8 family serine peptidase [Promethearchaeota archaeon]
MNGSLLLPKRSQTALWFSTILLVSMFVGISAAPISQLLAPAFTSSTPSVLPENFFNGNPTTSMPKDVIDPLANINKNLHSWIETGSVPSNIRSRDGASAVILGVTLDVDWDELELLMDIKDVFQVGPGYLVQGWVSTPKNLKAINALDYTGMITGDEYIEFRSDSNQDQPVVDKYVVRDIIGVDDIETYYPDINGTGVTIGICDTGVDFGHTDLAGQLDRDGGLPTTFDPGGNGIMITSYALPVVGGYLLTEGLDFTMWVAAFGGTRLSNTTYGIYTHDLFVGGFGGITSMSGFYKVGMGLIVGSGVARNFFVFMLVDSTTPFVYDTLYIDWETSWAITADYNGIATSVSADWDFTNNAPHQWGDGTEVLAFDADSDGYNDYSAGNLGWTNDIYDLITGDLIGGIDPQGRGFAHFHDSAYHGTWCAGSAAGAGIQTMDIYGNGTLYNLPGIAPGAKVMGLMTLTGGDYLTTWFWGAGYHPATSPPSRPWWLWTYTGAHQADVLSNSWGYVDEFFGGAYNFFWGVDGYSGIVDFLSCGGLEDWNDYAGPPHPAPVFVFSAGNAGPGYGTSGSPAGQTAIMVGASTTAHYAQPTYNNDSSLGAQPYDQIADFSSNGPFPQSSPLPDVVAPGAYAFDISPLTLAYGDGAEAWTTWGGTSQSAPFTAGVVALMKQVNNVAQPDPATRVGGIYESLLKASADDIGQPALRQGAGRINAYRAIEMMFGNATDHFGNPLVYMWSDNTFGEWGTYGDVSGWWRAWYMNMYYGVVAGTNTYSDGDSYYHPGVSGFAGAPNVTWYDAGFTTHSMKAGDTKELQVGAGLAGGTVDLDSMSAEWFTLVNESSQTFTSLSTYTTYPLFATGHFDKAFQAQFMAADYAVIHLNYGADNFEEVYLTNDLFMANYVFLHDWNDTNGNGIIDYQSADSVGEVRRVSYDQTATNCHQIHVGNPGAQWNGNRNATIYYHDVGNEFFLWRSLEVTVTIRLFNRVTWNWFSFVQDSGQIWNVTVDVPSGASPGYYSGFVTGTYSGFTKEFPVVVRVDGDVAPGSSLTWGGTDGHPYDNGAITGGLDWDGRHRTGEWRFYIIDVTDDLDTGDNITTWIMTNVTWMDPDTTVDIFFLMTGYGNNAWLGGDWFSSDTQYVTGGRWDGESTSPTSQVHFTDFAWGAGVSGTSRGWFMLVLHVSRYGGNYIPENLTITVTPVNNATLPSYVDYSFAGFPAGVGDVNVTTSTITNQEIVADGSYTGPHASLTATLDPYSVPGFPSVEVDAVDLQYRLSDVRTFTGWFVESNCTPDSNYGGPPWDAEFEWEGIAAGMALTAYCEWYASPDLLTPDIDFFLYAPNGQVFGNWNPFDTPELIEVIAPVSGTYIVGVDYFDDDSASPYAWGPWDYIYFEAECNAQAIISNPAPGLTVTVDTHDLGLNTAVDVVLKGLTGTSLDATTLIEVAYPNVTFTNYFEPTISITNPVTGDVKGPGPFAINWTASDTNLDETLSFQVYMSNNAGVNWSLVVAGTTDLSTVWDPDGFYGMNATDQMMARVIVTDGMYTVTDETGIFTLTPTPAPGPPPPYELYVVIAVIVIVILILLTTCILKRRQVAKT